MDLLGAAIWRRFWYPLALVESLAGGPVARTLLGERLVLWADGDGRPRAAADRCPHRDAPLSAGWTQDGTLVCPYHGWRYGPDGRAVLVPQTPAIIRFPERFCLQTYRAEERAGCVWVCLGEPVRAIPGVPGDPAASWRRIPELDEEWRVPAARLMENSFDPAHTVFVHRATFGDTARPDVDTPEVQRTDGGLVASSDLSVANPDIARAVTGEVGAATMRSSRTDLHAPFVRVLRSAYPGGAVHQIVTAVAPVDDRRLRMVQWAVRNDTEEVAPAADVVAFDRQVTWEDQRLLEAVTVPYSEALDANVHIRVDRATVEIRRIYQQIEAGTWDGLHARSPEVVRHPGTSDDTTIAVVDLQASTEGSAADRRVVVDQIRATAEEIGFLVVAGHGVPAGAINDAYQVTEAFFALADEEKRQTTPSGWDRFCGFAGIERGTGPDSPSGHPDLREMFHANRFDGPHEAMDVGYPVDVANRLAPNLWPARPVPFRHVWRRYYDHMAILASRIDELFALALGLPATWFEPFVGRHLSNLAANWYPPQPVPPAPGQVRSSPHIDFSLLTILHQDDAPGGLQVRHPQKGWLPVPFRPGTFVVNLGDLMNRLTNDRWVATLHRVVNPPRQLAGRGRISIPYFQMPDWESVVECVPTCRPRSGLPNYPPVVSGPYAEERRAGRRAATAV